jgi:murein DD-endopeptidase MepM/ murein hydrolase activator NlpD
VKISSLPRSARITLAVSVLAVVALTLEAVFTPPSLRLQRALGLNLFYLKSVRGQSAPPLRIVTYRLEPGDNLWDLSQRLGVGMDTLVAFNEIQKAHNLQVGQVLKIPTVDGLLYRAATNEDLPGISSNHHVSLAAVAFYNGLAKGTAIAPGQALFLPGASYSMDERLARYGAELMSPMGGGYRFTGFFGWRVHPISRAREFHRGLDLGAQTGSPVVAAQSGTVLYATIDYGYGQFIAIQHRKGLVTRYAHLSRMYVRGGQKVQAQQVIGAVGMTGRVTGPHLHFEVLRDGVAIDPREVTAFQ